MNVAEALDLNRKEVNYHIDFGRFYSVVQAFIVKDF